MRGLDQYLTVCLILMWNYVLPRIRADDDDFQVKADPCRPAGEDSGEYAEIFVKTDSQLFYYIGLPKNLSPGSYRCEWRLILLDAVGSEHSTDKPNVGFVTIFDLGYAFSWNNPNRFDSIGQVSLTVPEAEFSIQKVSLSQYMPEKTIRTPNNTVIVLEATVDKSYNKYVNFARIHLTTNHFDFPKRFKVQDIIGKTKLIRNHRFTWLQARRFCKSTGLDLCPTYDENICDLRARFSHAQPNISTQYFPILPYNYWMTVTDGACDEDMAGPPRWGLRGTLCPQQGCKSKSYIYCCYDRNFRTIKYEPTFQYVTSARDINGQIYYRFSQEETYENSDDPYYHDYDLTKNSWIDIWKLEGRIPGDIGKFKMSASYSKRTPTVIYFCEKIVSHISLTELGNHRFMLDLKPCQHPWEYKYYGYVSKKPKKGFRALYVGQSKQGHGSRISTRPRCCDYEENGFVIYAEVRRKWIYEIKPELCGEFQLPDATSNITILESSELLPDNAHPPLYCTWRINASSPGEGIDIEYKLKETRVYDDTSHEYIRFKNPMSGRIYSQSKGGSFVTGGNSVEINMAVEVTSPSFYIKYYTVNKTSSEPVGYKVEDGNVSWSRASSICRNASLELCSQKDICPAGDYPYGGIRDSWIAVSDRFNEWTKAGLSEYDENTVCDFVSTTEGPPDWDDKNQIFPDHSWVYCCDTPIMQWPEWKPTRVYIGISWRGEHFFSIMEEWDPPLYKYNYEDPYHEDPYHEDPYHDEPYDVYPWRPPSSRNGSKSNTIDYFVSSNRYVENVFDQAIYFCEKRSSFQSPFDSVFMASMSQCKYPWSYKFHIYAGRTKSEEAPVLLTVGNVNSNDHPACCKRNPNSFEIYVVDSGKAEPIDYSGNMTDETGSTDDYDYLY